MNYVDGMRMYDDNNTMLSALTDDGIAVAPMEGYAFKEWFYYRNSILD